MLALVEKPPPRPVPSNRHLYFILSLPQPSPHRLFLHPLHHSRHLPLDSLDHVLARRERRPRRLLAAVVVPVDVAVPLRQLRDLVDQVAAEEEVVLRLDGERVAHERGRVDGQGKRHLARDAARGEDKLVLVPRGRGRGAGDVQLGALLGVGYGGEGDAEVGDGTPEVWREGG